MSSKEDLWSSHSMFFNSNRGYPTPPLTQFRSPGIGIPEPASKIPLFIRRRYPPDIVQLWLKECPSEGEYKKLIREEAKKKKLQEEEEAKKKLFLEQEVIRKKKLKEEARRTLELEQKRKLFIEQEETRIRKIEEADKASMFQPPTTPVKQHQETEEEEILSPLTEGSFSQGFCSTPLKDKEDTSYFTLSKTPGSDIVQFISLPPPSPETELPDVLHFCPRCLIKFDDTEHEPRLLISCGHTVCLACLNCDREILKICFICQTKSQEPFPINKIILSL
jgi:hypothetical protein